MLTNLVLRALVALQGLESHLQQKVQDEDGQTLAEYGLIMAVIAVAVIVAAAVAFKTAIVNSFKSATNCLAGTTAGCS
jgi:Flp pilus assembly pilin Flp